MPGRKRINKTQRKRLKPLPSTVSGMLCHFSAGFTLDTYAHVTTASQVEAANTMSSVLAAV